ncbi:hypothetical protein MCAP1_001828 [Malassezia caprae]|uniref:C2 NT-type domain-containing protein n=1 Tax=Malassezia caprae TaxID=1381934 RepID=A0AAF0E753_9BASI|nr:hypothetical protein MCAP1_001828 [Malassezia caprae]
MARRALLGPFPLSTRHAHFQVCVYVHELIHVPLLSGEFSLDWHIKHSVGHPRKTLASLASVDEDNDDDTERSMTLAQAEGAERAQEVLESPATDLSSVDADGRRVAWPVPGDDAPRSPVAPSTPNLSPRPPVTESPELVRSAAARDDTQRPVDSPAADDASAHAPAPSRRMRPRARSNTANTAGSSIFAVVQHHTASGQTNFLGVQGHSVQWDSRIESVVRMGVGRPDAESETKDSDSIRSARSESSAGRLRPSRIRLRVYRRQADEGHTDSRQKFGSLTLDLAEYAPRLSGATGSHTRRESRQFLLDNCSCNALLRLTLEVTYLDGTQSYVVPSIQQGMLDPANLQAGERTARLNPSGSDLSPSGLDEPGRGLEWHSKLPLPLLYHSAAVKPEFVRHDEAHALSSQQRSSLVHSFSYDASQPRHTYCRMNSAALIDDLFSGLLGPMEDERTEAQAPPSAPHRRRMRWRQLIHSAGAAAKPASSDELHRPGRSARPRSGEQPRKHGRPLPFRIRTDVEASTTS